MPRERVWVCISFRLIDLSMAPHRGVLGEWWTVRRLSHAIEHFGNRFPILCLSLKDATVDSLGELAHLGRGGHIVPTLGVDLSDVGVRGGFVHAGMMARIWGQLGDQWTPCPLAHWFGIQTNPNILSSMGVLVAAPILNKESS